MAHAVRARPQPPAVAYRADIDGLRGLAILLVVFWHYGVPGFSGGFIGVDIFFVISGYLIASIIAVQAAHGKFSLVRFFEARLRRLLPALLLLLAVTFVISAVILFPVDFDFYARSAAATALFVSNFLFARESADYFDISSQLKPLLHSWSLGVEGQFYLLFPFLILAPEAGNRRIALIALLALVSLGLSIWQTHHAPLMAFFLIPSRAWELLLGVLLALWAPGGAAARPLREAVAVLALLAILGAGIFYRETMAFPGAAALVPCLATAALIWSGGGASGFVHRGLAAWPLNGLGLISYSLYLWHWPVLVFARYLSVSGISGLESWLLIFLSLALAYFSWRHVELPFRKPRKLLSRRNFLLAGAAAASMVVLLSYLVVRGQGLPQRYKPQMLAVMAAPLEQASLIGKCANPSAAKMRAGDFCRFGATAAKPDTILWGDSHAFFLMPALGQVLAAKGRSAILVEHPGCMPLIGVGRLDDGLCADANVIVRGIVRDPAIKTVILEARWADYLWPQNVASLKLDRDAGGRSSNRRIFDRQLEPTVKELAGLGKQVVLVGSVPEIGWDVPRALAMAGEFGAPLPHIPSAAEFRARQAPVEQAFRRMREQYGALTPEPADRLCDAQSCKIVVEGKPLYRDDSHLSEAGSLFIAPVFAGLF